MADYDGPSSLLSQLTGPWYFLPTFAFFASRLQLSLSLKAFHILWLGCPDISSSVSKFTWKGNSGKVKKLQLTFALPIGYWI